MSDSHEMEGVARATLDVSGMEKGAKQGEKALEGLAKKSKETTQRLTADDKVRIESEKRLTQVSAGLVKERVVLARNEGEAIKNARAETNVQGRKDLAILNADLQKRNATIRSANTRLNNQDKEDSQRRLAILRDNLSRERDVRRQVQRQEDREGRSFQSILNRTQLAPPSVRDRVVQALGTRTGRDQVRAMVQGGLTRQEATLQQLRGSGFNQMEAAFLTGGFGVSRPVSLGARDVEAERAARKAEAEAERSRRAEERAAREERIAIMRANAQDAAEEAREQRIASKDAARQAQAAKREIDRDVRLVQGVMKRTLLAPVEIQRQVSAILNAPGAAAVRANMLSVGASPAQALQAQLGAGGLSPGVATFLAGGGGRRPPSLGGRPPGGGPPRGGGGIGGQILRGALSGLGFGVTGFGAYGAIQAARGVVEDVGAATAYERQRVAAENLAGSQAKLNALLEAYAEASGGAVDQATSLSNVTRLLATGYAKTVPEAERFVRATRGASIALGKPQEYVGQETQLAISNTSIKRLDQIGLGIEEVTERIEELRDANSSLTREGAFQEAVLSLMEQKYGHLTNTIEGQATGLEKLTVAWKDYRLELGKNAGSGVNAGASMLSQILNSPPSINSGLEDARRSTNEFWFNLMRQMGIEPSVGMQLSMPSNLSRGLAGSDDRQVNAAIMSSSIASRTGGERSRFDDDELASIRDFENRKAAIEEQYQEARLNEIEQYENQRSNIIRNYEKQIAREAEDFSRQRARANRDYEQQRSELIEDAAKRDAELTEDYTDTVADAREQSEERIAELNENHQKERERSLKDHMDRLLSAAGQLNAIAVLEERKRWKREQDDRNDAHKEQLEDAKDALAEQLAEAKESYEERLQDAREADQERLDDMRRAREQQIADEDEDRDVQLRRLEEDHDDQLEELDRQHGLRLKQIEDQAQAERDQWDKEFEDFLASLGKYVAGLTEKREAMDKLAEEWFDKQIEMIEEKLKKIEQDRGSAGVREPGSDPASGPTFSYAKGGSVHRTGPAILHAGEYVLSREMLGGSQPVSAAAAAAISNSKTIQTGDIVVQVMPGMENYVGNLLEQQLVEILDRVG